VGCPPTTVDSGSADPRSWCDFALCQQALPVHRSVGNASEDPPGLRWGQPPGLLDVTQRNVRRDRDVGSSSLCQISAGRPTRRHSGDCQRPSAICRAAASGFRPASMSSAGRSTGGWATPGTPRNPICTFMPRTTRSSTPTTAAAIDHLSAALRRRPGTARRSNVGTGQLADVRAVIISRRPVETGRELTSARTSAKVLTNDGLRSLRTASCQYFPTQSSLFITQLISGWSYTSMRRTINECG
jgi:hypothetical protein